MEPHNGMRLSQLHIRNLAAPRMGLHGRRVELGLPATLGPNGLGWLIGVLRDAGDRVGRLGGSTQASEWTFNQLSFCKGQKLSGTNGLPFVHALNFLKSNK